MFSCIAHSDRSPAVTKNISANIYKACSKRRATAVPNSMNLSFRFKHGSSTPFETIKPGTAELGSARLLSTASLTVPHGSFKRRAIVMPNSIHKSIKCILHYFHILHIICIYYIWRDCIRFDVWNRCRAIVVPLPGQIHLSSARQ